MNRVPPLPRLPFLLLGWLTVVSFGGPLALLLIVRGGPRADLPPDRPVEWIVIALVFGLFLVLFVACISIGWWYPWPRRGQGPPDQ
jgi:hypothetical protein